MRATRCRISCSWQGVMPLTICLAACCLPGPSETGHRTHRGHPRPARTSLEEHMDRSIVGTLFDAGAQYVAGALHEGTGDETFAVVNPADGSMVRQVRLASVADVDEAVAAARA